MTTAPPATTGSTAPREREVNPLDTSGTDDARIVLNDLYQQHSAALLMYVMRMLGDRHHAEDVVQETMLRAWRHAHTLDPRQGTGWRWLTRVARNIVIDRIRARQARPTEVDEPDFGERSTKWESRDLGERVATEMFVTSMLGRLIPAQRAVLYEVYYADRTTAGAADVLDIPVGTVKSRLHYALRALKKNIDQERSRAAS